MIGSPERPPGRSDDPEPAAGIAPIARSTNGRSVPVLFIGGCQRSGSTLLDRMASQVAGHVSAGEIVHLWTRGLRDNELCGCGQSFRACPFWAEVGEAAFGGWDKVDPEEMARLQRRVDRNRHIIFMLFPGLSRKFRKALAAYVAVLAPLYRAIAERGGGIVVDSSKHASTAFLLRRVAGVRLRVVHLVRDSRGVAFSLSKTVRRPEVRGSQAFMHRQAAWRAGAEWLAFNGLFHVLRATGTPVARIRYEDLVRSPREALGRLLSLPGEDAGADLGFIDGARVMLSVDHTVAGNPMRFEHGELELRVDDAWQRKMTARARRVTTMLTAPLLKAYGYRLGVR